jgi:uncharacterized protein DUF3634
MSLLIPALLVALSIPLVIALVRANELFYLRVRGEEVRAVRGRIPPALLSDIRDIVRAAPFGEGSIRGVVEDRRVQIYAEGELSQAQRQQLRNVVAMWPIAKIRAAPRA